MKKSFYTTVIDIEATYSELENVNLSKEEKEELILLIDSNIHCTILDVVMSELTDEDKKIFLKNVHSEDTEKVWQHLRSKIVNVETKIKETVSEITKELSNNIKELKKAKK